MTAEHMKKFYIYIVLIFAVAVCAYFYYKNMLLPAGGDIEKTVEIKIEKGSATSEIAELLFNEKLIKDKFVFSLYAQKNDLASRFKAGKYSFTRKMSVIDIADKIAAGQTDTNTINITIPEGLNIKETADILKKQTDIDIDIFTGLASEKKHFEKDYPFLKETSFSTLEGFLYPDTYNIYSDSSEEDIIRKMLDGYHRVYINKELDKLKEKEFGDIMVMASIVQGEAAVVKEMPMAASVFYNRINSRWRLESCATVQYALGERKEKLLLDDLKTDSEYNTYTNYGLPPGPINSPGADAIDAALNPAETNYMFFVAKGDGSHYFTDNYDDFLDAKYRYNSR